MKRRAAARRAASLLGIVLFGSSLASKAKAEITLVKVGGGWEVFTDGRVGGFGEYVKGDATPPSTVNGHSVIIAGEAFEGIRQVPPPLNPDGSVSDSAQGTLDHFRVRSGFVGNVFGFGVRRHLDESTTLKAYIAVWHYIQSDDWRKYIPNTPDVREGYLRVEGPFGVVTVGRMATLFSRGATEIDFLYGHGYGAGSPAGFQTNAPSGGHVGFGVLANGFGAGIEYATPPLAGLQLTVGVFDPNQLVGAQWELPRWPREEGELTYDWAGELGKLHLFANGAWQKVYHPQDPSKSKDVYGVGGGARVELGPVHLGVARHWGKGVGLNYTMESSPNVASALAPDYELRTFDGWYVQGQVVAVPHKLDLSAGWGITNEHTLQSDLYPPDGSMPISVLKHQQGISAGVVYHFSDELHFDVDYFRADIEWWLGEKQLVHTVSSGLTATW